MATTQRKEGPPVYSKIVSPDWHESPQEKAMKRLLGQGQIPDLIKLGAGAPARESFPILIIESIQREILENPSILNYGSDAGYKPLLEVLPSFFARENRKVEIGNHLENIAITAGSQEALFILGMIYLFKPGSKVAVASPTYIGALDAFSPFNPNYIEIKTDKDGIIPEELEKTLDGNRDNDGNCDIKFLYEVLTFKNPDGKTTPLYRRKEIADILKKYGVLGVEDDPYSELRYKGETIQSLQSLAPDNVIHLFTFSKTLAPDFRIGGAVAPKEIIKKIIDMKKRMGLYTSSQDQAVVATYLERGHLEQHLPKILQIYKPRRDAMFEAVKKYFPEVFECSLPEGGLFLWPHLKEDAMEYKSAFNMEKIMDEAEKLGVGFLYGAPFFANSTGNEPAMRLNFSNQSEENIERGIQIIGELLHRKLETALVQ